MHLIYAKDARATSNPLYKTALIFKIKKTQFFYLKNAGLYYTDRWRLVHLQLIFYLFSFSQHRNFYIPKIIKSYCSIPLRFHSSS